MLEPVPQPPRREKDVGSCTTYGSVNARQDRGMGSCVDNAQVLGEKEMGSIVATSVVAVM